jgi:hypothetical protein
MQSKLVITILLGAIALTMGCASTDSRINKHSDLFATFSPDIQEAIRAGRVQIGYTTDMVFMALGKPHREYVRNTAAGQTQVWSYTDYYTLSRRQMVDGQFRVRDPRSGRMSTVSDSVWADVMTYHEYDRVRIEFENGKVVAVEEQVR